MGYIFVSKLISLLDDDEEESKPGQVKEAVRQVKKAAEAEKLGPDGDVQLDERETQAQEVSDDEDMVPEEQPEDAMFIPLGWPQKRPREYYKGSDPEWRSFLEFARSEKQGRVIRSELAGIVGGHFSGDKRLQQILGSPITVQKYWLDVDYPYGPPQEYEQSGIEITGEYIAWVIRPVDAINVARLQNAITPTPLLYSLWASYKTVWDSSVARVRKALDMEPSSKRFPPGFALPQLEEDEVDEESSQTQSTVKPSPTQDQNQSSWTKYLPPLPQPGQDYANASQAFKKTLAKNWSKGVQLEPPRGTVVVSGLVELDGPKGFCVLDVRAAYETRASQWVAIAVGIRRAQPRVQRPKG